MIPLWMSQWLTPVWILGVGCVGGLLLLGLFWGAAVLVGMIAPPVKRFADAIPGMISEGVLLWVFVFTAIFASFGLGGFFVAPNPGQLLHSLVRLPAGGTTPREVTIPAPKNDADDSEHKIAAGFNGDEIRMLEVLSSEDLVLRAVPSGEDEPGMFAVRVEADQPSGWMNTNPAENPFRGEYVDSLYIVNKGSEEAKVSLKWVTGPAHPQMETVPITAFCILFVFVFYFAHAHFAPKMSAIALATFKSELAQPMFLIMSVAGSVALFGVFLWIPYFTFGEDIKMLKNSGLSLILVLAIIQAIWSASHSVSDEIEGRTALTVLSKPVGRRSFIIGKYVGIMWTVALLFMIVGSVLIVTVAYKPIHDKGEGVEVDAQVGLPPDVSWQLCHLEGMSVVPGLALGFMETAVLAAISVAISTRLPMLANFTISTAIYVLGHLTPLMVQTTQEHFEIVRFVAVLISTVFPVLDHFNIQAAIAGGADVPYWYLMTCGWYSFFFCGIALLIALLFFEDRDLA